MSMTGLMFKSNDNLKMQLKKRLGYLMMHNDPGPLKIPQHAIKRCYKNCCLSGDDELKP